MTKTHASQLRAAEENARVIASKIGPVFDAAGCGFVLIAFKWGDDGFSSYISNVRREDVVTAIRELADKLEAGDTLPSEPAPPFDH